MDIMCTLRSPCMPLVTIVHLQTAQIATCSAYQSTHTSPHRTPMPQFEEACEAAREAGDLAMARLLRGLGGMGEEPDEEGEEDEGEEEEGEEGEEEEEGMELE